MREARQQVAMQVTQLSCISKFNSEATLDGVFLYRLKSAESYKTEEKHSRLRLTQNSYQCRTQHVQCRTVPLFRDPKYCVEKNTCQ